MKKIIKMMLSYTVSLSMCIPMMFAGETPLASLSLVPNDNCSMKNLRLILPNSEVDHILPCAGVKMLLKKVNEDSEQKIVLSGTIKGLRSGSMTSDFDIDADYKDKQGIDLFSKALTKVIHNSSDEAIYLQLEFAGYNFHNIGFYVDKDHLIKEFGISKNFSYIIIVPAVCVGVLALIAAYFKFFAIS